MDRDDLMTQEDEHLSKASDFRIENGVIAIKEELIPSNEVANSSKVEFATSIDTNHEPDINIKEESIFIYDSMIHSEPLEPNGDIDRQDEDHDVENTTREFIHSEQDIERIFLSSLCSPFLGGMTSSHAWLQKENIEELFEHSIFRISKYEQYKDDFHNHKRKEDTTGASTSEVNDQTEDGKNKLNNGCTIIQTDDRLKPFKCSKCNFKTKFRKTLKRHFLVHSETKLFHCLECTYETNYKSHLKTHILTHSDLKPYKCPLCDFETNHKTSLKSHSLTHAVAKSFKCSKCSYKTSRNSDYKNHMVKHSDTKMFKCAECGFETYYKKNLKIHSLKHSKFKLYKCVECTYETNRKDRLKAHFLIHTKIKLYKCSECNYACNQKVRLRKHSLIHLSATETNPTETEGSI